MNESYHESVIFVKPRTNKESRDIIKRLHNIGKTEFYKYFYGEYIKINKDIKSLNKLFGKDYIYCIDKRKEKVIIIPPRMFPPGTMKIITHKEFMEMDTFELLGSFKEMDLINREVARLIESGIDLPINCCERFDLIKPEEVK